MVMGTVVYFNRSSRYGIIEQDSGEDVFVYERDIRGVNPVLIPGERVEFDIDQRHRRTIAQRVVRVA